MAPKILLAAVEPSADAMGASLLRALKPLVPDARWFGCGGPLMQAEGFASQFDISAFSVMGFTDVARVLPAAWSRSRDIARTCAEEEVDIAVFVDGWSFSRLCAKRIRQRSPSTKIVKLAAPQVWASRPQRTEFVKDHFDLVLTLLPFEPPLFEAVGVESHFVGNPNFDHVCRAPRSGSKFRARHDIGADPVLCLLPGSRKGEVTRLLDIFGDAVARVAADVRGLRPVIPAAPAVRSLISERAARWPVVPLIVGPEEKFDAFDAADAALAASGTVTTELAITSTPMVVAYRVDPLTAFWARRVLVTQFVSIMNVMAGEMVIPERLQADCTPEQLAADAIRLLTDEKTRTQQLGAFRRLLPGLLGKSNPSEEAANRIASLLERENRLDFDRSAER